VRAEGGSDAVEVVEGALVAVQLPGLVVLRVIQFPHLGALENLVGLRDDLRIQIIRILRGAESVLQGKQTVLHFFLWRVAGPAHADGLFEVLPLVRDKIDGAFAAAQQVLGGIGGIAAVEQHGVVILAGHIIGLHQTVRTAGRHALLCQSADQHSRHGEKGGCLIEIVHDAEIFKAAQNRFLLSKQNFPENRP